MNHIPHPQPPQEQDRRRDSKISLAESEMGALQLDVQEPQHPQASAPVLAVRRGSGAVTPMTLEEGGRWGKNSVDLTEYTVGRLGEDLYDANTHGNRALLWKQDLRIVPLSAFIYLLCYLDRSNIGNAGIMNSETHNDLKTELKISDEQYVIALMTFLIAYALFEVPSNYFLKKMSPSRWVAFLMISWGLITIGMGGVRSYATLTVTRFLLGLFEAGLFPGLVYYLTFWYRVEERSLRVAIILASGTLAGAFGGAIAYGISHMNGVLGHSAWRWLFILEGIPSCLSAIAVYFFLPDYPETATWLTPAERTLAARRLVFNGSRGNAKAMTWYEFIATLRDIRLYAHYLIYFAMSVSFSSLSLFTPSITNGLGYSSITAQLMTVPPWACAYIVTLIVALTSDRFDARAAHSAAAMLVGAIGFLASAALPADRFAARYICLILACAGSSASIPPLLGWLTGNLHSTSAAGLAIALNVSFGAPGQIVGVWIYQADEKLKGYPTGHWTNVGMLVLGAALIMGLRAWYAGQNEMIRREGGGRPLWKL